MRRGFVMKDPRLLSPVPRTRQPRVAALLSFLFPGAGELYNGASSHYLFLILLQPVVTLSAVPVLLNPAPPALWVTASLFLFLISIPPLSAFHAWLQAWKIKSIVAGFWNRPVGLSLSIFFAFLLRALPLLILVQFLFLHRVTDMENAPTLLPGEIILCSRLPAFFPEAGELVLDREDRLGRIIALPGETVLSENGLILVDRFPLVHKHIHDRDLFRLGIENPASVTSERHRERRYAVTMGNVKLKKRVIRKETVMVMGDNRSQEDPVRNTPVSSIKYRVEGVLLPARWQRFLLRPVLPYSSSEEFSL